ncbi:MAG: ribonuclease R [Pseudomonas fluorescens]|nr:MAG: ribonuclease R [Pseudomonas fluorescens]
MCEIRHMKSRTRPYGPKPRNPHKDDSRASFNKGSRAGGRDRRGGKGDRPPARSPRPASERPSTMVAQVLREGAYLRGRVLQRDLVNIDFEVLEGELTLEHGDFAEVVPESAHGKRLVAIKKVPANEAATWAAICNHGLRHEWPAEVEIEVEKLKAYTWNAEDKREDWRKLPIVTIDGADARDFDDAVWAEEWEGDGHHIIVAIADVAQYVKEGSPLDKEAVLRGNSTYFPDRVIPMLPERLSNDLCSLRPKEDRPVLGVEMWISAQGRLVKHAFKRGCIHSAARLTYEQVQAVFEGEKGVVEGHIGEALQGLRAAYATLQAAREKRGALDLDIPEVKLDVKDGKIVKVGVRARLEAHRLIEELMILANVAAATTLSMKGGGLYRIHPEPSREKLENLKSSLGPLGFTVPAPNGGPKAWARLVAQIHGHPAAQTLLRAVLQSQSQAKYDPSNIGHYGLALPLYSHFTSPIRRYADLVVHRALLQAMGLNKGEEDEAMAMVGLARVAEIINATERKSQQAEWESRDRMVAQHFAGLVGKEFEGIIISVVPFGCFVAVEGVAEGLLPKWDLGRDWVYVGGQTCWRKTRGKGTLRVGNKVNVTLKEADALGGRLTFGLAGEGDNVFVETRKRSFREDGMPVMPAPSSSGMPEERSARMERPVRPERKFGKKPGAKAGMKPHAKSGSKFGGKSGGTIEGKKGGSAATRRKRR